MIRSLPPLLTRPLAAVPFFVSLLTPGFADLVPLPDGDFAVGQGGWVENFGGAGVTYEYPSAGGNPAGYGIIDQTGGGTYAIWISNFNAPILLSDLGLEAGKAYRFVQDMKIFAGAKVGGLKVDFFDGDSPSGSTGELFPTLIGDGSTWQTYEFQVGIPPGTDGLKVVPLWGAGSRVGYDNFKFDDTPVEIPDLAEIPNAGFENGSDQWAEGGGENTVFRYEAGGGNPGGYSIMDNNGSGFGVLVSNGGVAVPIAGLGLQAGETYRFTQDMRLLSGSELGGLKVEFLKGTTLQGDTGDMRPSLIGDGSTWETYQFEVSLPLDIDGIKLVPLWGPGSVVGFDNLGFDDRALPSPPVREPEFENGGVAWATFASGTTFRFPATGGQPNGYVEMTHDGALESWGVVVSNNSGITPKSKFGITEEGSYEFKIDMKIFEGTSVGGLKVEFFENGIEAGSSGDLFPAPIGDGTGWETYTFDVFIPEFVDGLKVTLLWGAGSTIGIDNVVVPGALGEGFARWIAGFPGVGALNELDDDPDGDGHSNRMENFLGTDPTQPGRGLTPSFLNAEAQPGEFFFAHPINVDPVPEAADGNYRWSTDLETFYEDGEAAPDGTRVAFDTNPDGVVTTGSTRVVKATSLGALVPERLFVRLVVSGQ